MSWQHEYTNAVITSVLLSPAGILNSFLAKLNFVSKTLFRILGLLVTVMCVMCSGSKECNNPLPLLPRGHFRWLYRDQIPHADGVGEECWCIRNVVLWLPVVSNIVGLLWQRGEYGCCIVRHTRLTHLTALRNSPFYYTSTNHIQLTAGRYSRPYGGL